MSGTSLVRYQEHLPNCCGVDDIGGFGDVFLNADDEPQGHHWEGCQVQKSGTGLFTATFIDSDACKAAYEVLCKEHKLLYQSPVKENENSGNDLFLCVFQYKAPRRPRNRLPQL